MHLKYTILGSQLIAHIERGIFIYNFIHKFLLIDNLYVVLVLDDKDLQNHDHVSIRFDYEMVIIFENRDNDNNNKQISSNLNFVFTLYSKRVSLKINTYYIKLILIL